MRIPFRYFKTSPEIIRRAVMMNARFPLSLWNAVDLVHERGVDISHETLRFWYMPREGWKSVPFPPPVFSREPETRLPMGAFFFLFQRGLRTPSEPRRLASARFSVS
jgi:hypothetical protein